MIESESSEGQATLPQPTILVVDDEPAVRSYVGNILRREGYQLVEAVDGVDAMERAHQAPRVDLVVTDIRMPRMDGIALARAITEYRPHTPILYISGYPFDSEATGQPEGICASLAKPFTRRALLDAVAKCLPAPAAGGNAA